MDRIAYTAPWGSWLVVDVSGDDSAPGHVCTPEACAALVEAGVYAVVRMVRPDDRVLDEPDSSGGDWQGCYSLSRQEAGWILDAGLGLSIYQASSGLVGAQAGAAQGAALATQADGLGLLRPTTIWTDLEGSRARGAGRAGCAEHLRAAEAAVYAAGWGHGLYYDAEAALSPLDLWRLPRTSAYWLAGGPRAAGPLYRGAALTQDPDQGVVIGGIHCDRDHLRQDAKGQGPAWTISHAGAARWENAWKKLGSGWVVGTPPDPTARGTDISVT